jgi:hypothetical protein
LRSACSTRHAVGKCDGTCGREYRVAGRWTVHQLIVTNVDLTLVKAFPALAWH